MALITYLLLPAVSASLALAEVQGCVCGNACVMGDSSSGTCQEDGVTCAVNIVPPKCPLKVGDVCKAGGVAIEQLTDAAKLVETKECPAGSSCLPKPGVMGIGGEVPHTCQLHQPTAATAAQKPVVAATVQSLPLAPIKTERQMLDFGEVCKSGGVETGPGVSRQHDCPPRSVCAPLAGEAAIGGEVSWTCQKHDNPLPVNGMCTTAGSMLALPTTCDEGLECVLIDAGRPEVDVPNLGICLTKGTKLAVDAACKPSLNESSCAPTLQCTVNQGAAPVEDANGGLVNVAYACKQPGALPPPMMKMPVDQIEPSKLIKKVVRAELQQGEACTTTGTRGAPARPCVAGLKCLITNPGKPEVDIPNAGTCEPEQPSKPKGCVCGSVCAMGDSSSGTCQEDGITCAVNFLPPKCPLKVGDVCKAGGVETEQLRGSAGKRMEAKECPAGSSCLPKPGVMGIGGEVPHTCQLPQATIARATEKPAVAATVQSLPLAPIKTERQMLDFGEICKSGGVETGPGVSRQHDCPPRSVCTPLAGEVAIGGEVSWTCQKHDNPLPVNGMCTTAGSMLALPTTCDEGLECVLIDAGRPEVDVPNLGICLTKGTKLAVDAACKPSLNESSCAPTLQCTVNQGAAPIEEEANGGLVNVAHACKQPGALPPPMMKMPVDQAEPSKLIKKVVRAELQQGEACTTTGTRGAPARPCVAGLKCLITNPGKPEVDIPNAGTCEPEQPSKPKGCVCGSVCAMGDSSSGTCQEDGITCAVNFLPPKCPLKVGDVCKAGGVETEQLRGSVGKRMEAKECPAGSSCLPKPGVMGIGGEVPHTCQLPQATIARATEKPAVAATVQSLPLAPIKTERQMLDFGEICKSGGVETGPGVSRQHDCPPRSVCAPMAGEVAIGGEVSWTCQKHGNPLPVNGMCTTAGSMLALPTTCDEGLECVLIDAGRPEVDVPNLGICLTKGTKLAVDAACKPSLNESSCAPTLQCTVNQGAAPVEEANGEMTNVAYACKQPGALPPPMMQMPDSGDEGIESIAPVTSENKDIAIASLSTKEQAPVEEMATEEAHAAASWHGSVPSTRTVAASGCALLAMVACMPLARQRIFAFSWRGDEELRESLVG